MTNIFFAGALFHVRGFKRSSCVQLFVFIISQVKLCYITKGNTGYVLYFQQYYATYTLFSTILRNLYIIFNNITQPIHYFQQYYATYTLFSTILRNLYIIFNNITQPIHYFSLIVRKD